MAPATWCLPNVVPAQLVLKIEATSQAWHWWLPLCAHGPLHNRSSSWTQPTNISLKTSIFTKLWWGRHLRNQSQKRQQWARECPKRTICHGSPPRKQEPSGTSPLQLFIAKLLFPEAQRRQRLTSLTCQHATVTQVFYMRRRSGCRFGSSNTCRFHFAAQLGCLPRRQWSFDQWCKSTALTPPLVTSRMPV